MNPEYINNRFESLQKNYAKHKRPLEFDFRDFVVSNLQIKRSDVFTHNIHKYPGRLFPYIPISFLSSNIFCPPNGKILDPFTGSGTVLLESIVNPIYKRDVYGVEITPIGRLISKVKTTPLNPSNLDDKIEKLLSLLEKRVHASDYRHHIPNFNNIDLWFSKKAIIGLAKLKCVIEKFDDDDYKDLFWVCFSRIVRSVSKADPYIPPPVVLKLEKYQNSYRFEKLSALCARNESPDIKTIYKEILSENVIRVKRLWDIKEVREDSVSAKIIWDDARNIKRACFSHKGILNKDNVRSVRDFFSLIVTSPPYLSAQKYIRSTSLESLWLGLATANELTLLNRESIGTEKVSLSYEKHFFSISSIDKLLTKVEMKSRHRMLIASEYFKNMTDALKCIYNITSSDGYIVLVLGNNKICDMAVNTTKLLSHIAQEVGFSEKLILKDEIRSRGMMTKRHGTGGLIRDEYVLILRKS